MEPITIKKIWHREAYRIGVFFEYDEEIKLKVKSLNAKYSKTFHCWYIDYDQKCYNQLKSIFPDLIIDNPKENEVQTCKATGKNSRDILPTAPESAIQLDSNKNNPEHTKEEIPLATRCKLQKQENIGKYWVFKMVYHQEINKKLLAVKGVHWNKNYRSYVAYRHPTIKKQIEEILQTSNFLGVDYYYKDQSYKGEKISLQAHKEDPNWMEIFVPKLVNVHEKMKRFSFVRYSKSKDCYLIPAAPEYLESIGLQMDALQITIENNLPSGYVHTRNKPNKKQLDISKTKQSIFTQVPEKGKIYVEEMVNMLLALNYSTSTMRNYCNSWNQFLKHFDYKNPQEITQQEIIVLLGLLMAKGLQSTTGHTMINAI